MEQVSLRVKVIDAELNELEARVNKIKNTNVSINANSSGIDAAAEGFKKGAKELKKFSDAATEAGKSSDTLTQNISKFTTWYLIGGAVSSAIGAFKDAISTMKDVDSALATVQKVTGESDAAMKRLGDTAYETASKYGVAANDFLKAAGSFAKAGYENYDAMAELATKVQLVGDVTADTASQFVISANAAWKMGGDIERLSTVLDAANEVENNYATSIEKLADGLPIVASTAANAGMSMEQVIAALGTITAVTQETGTKAATALRALILNLQGAVGEYEEGFEVTEESVKSLNGLLNIYAEDAMKAADAAGTIINPLEAIAALSKAAEDGLLNQAELFDLLSGLGGKLRTNQLTALVTNFDMLNDMLKTVGESAGSADRELDVMLNTWDAKVNILKNTWAEFISGLVDTDAVKTGLDGIIFLVDALDSEFGHFALTVGTATIAVALLSKGFSALRSTSVIAFLFEYISAVSLAASGSTAAASAITFMNAALFASPLFKFAAFAAGIYGAVKTIDALIVTTDELHEKLEDVNDELEKSRSEYEQLKSKNVNDLTEAEKRRLLVLEEQTKELRAQKKELSRQALDSYKSEVAYYERGEYYGKTWKGEDIYQTVAVHNDEYAEKLLERAKAEETLTALTRDERDALSEYISELQTAQEELGALHEDEQALLDTYVSLIDVQEEAVTVYEEFQAKTVFLKNALDELNDTNVIQKSTLDDLLAAYPELQDSVEITANGYVIEKSKIEDLIKARRADYETALDNARTAAQTQIAALNDESIAWSNNTKQIIQNLQARAAALRAEADAYEKERLGTGDERSVIERQEGYQKIVGEALAYEKALSSVNAYVSAQNDLNTFDFLVSGGKKTTGGRGTGSGGSKSGGGSGGKTTSETSPEQEKEKAEKAELKRRKDIVSLLKSELSLYKERGDAENVQIAKMREIQRALNDEADYMRSIGSSQEEINGLSEEWWKYQNQIISLQKDILDLQKEQVDAADDLVQDYYNAQNDALNAQKDALEKTRDAEDDRLSIAEKQLAVEKAREALTNAQRERTVRQYNASSGQWEWVANQQNVDNAKKSYEDALKDLEEFEENLEYKEKVADLDRQIERNKKQAQKIDNSVNAFIDAVMNGSDDTESAFRDVIYALEECSDLSDDLRKKIYSDLINMNAEAYYTSTLSGGEKSGVSNNAGYSANVDYSALMLEASSLEEFSDLAAKRTAKIKSQNMDTSKIRSNEQLLEEWLRTHTYDSGGVLSGLGGIKATRENEIILPPDISGKMLAPVFGSEVKSRFEELRWLYGGGQKPASVSGTRIGSQHNGNVYNIGGCTITESKAKTTSVYDFVRMSRGIKIYNSTN